MAGTAWRAESDELGLRAGMAGLERHRHGFGLRRQLPQEAQPLCRQLRSQGGDAGEFAAGAIEAGDETELDGSLFAGCSRATSRSRCGPLLSISTMAFPSWPGPTENPAGSPAGFLPRHSR